MTQHDESYPLKDCDHQFEITHSRTEWDHWCEHRLDIIDRKFGPMPFMRPFRGVFDASDSLRDIHWCRWDPDLVHSTLREHPVVRLNYGSLEGHVRQLFEACAATGRPRVIISHTRIPHDPPENVRVIVTEPLAYQFSRTVSDARLRPAYQRRASALRHPFMIMARSTDHGRPRLMLMLEQLGLLRDALYSVSDIRARDYLFREDHVGVNAALGDLSARVLGDSYIKMDVRRNLGVVPALLELCHFYVSIDINGLYTEPCLWPVAEKNLWGYTTATPTLPIWPEHTAQQMREWGYRFQNTPYRLEGEAMQATVIRWCQEILFHHQITQNERWSQSWQDLQGEIATHNFKLTQDLHQIIQADVERQIQELPAEFQSL